MSDETPTWITVGETFTEGDFTVAKKRYGTGAVRIRVERLRKEKLEGVHAFTPDEARIVARLLVACASQEST